MSTGRTVRIVLEAATAGFEQGMQRAAAATKALEKEVKRAEKTSQGLGQASGKTATGAAATATALDGAGKAATGYTGSATAAAAATQTLGQKIEKNEKHLNTVATVMAVGGAAALAFAGASVKAYADFDSAMSGVAAATRAPERDMAKLREAAMQLGADTKFSATEAAGGIEALGRAGVSTRDILGGGLKGSLDLAAAGNLQVAEAAELASIAMTQFKLRGKDVPHVADLLAAGAGKAMGEVSDLGMALKQSGLVASQFGLSIEETVGGLSAFASAGLLGSDAGTSFKSMLLKLADPSKETKKTMAELGINAYNAQGQFIGLAGLAGELRDKLSHLTEAQRQQALAQIFGTDAIRAATILYNEGAEGIQRWTAAVDDAGYAADQAAILQDNLAGDLEKVGGAWDTLMIRMGSAANGPFRAAAQAVDGFLTALGNNEAAAQTLFVVAAGLGAAALATAGLIKGVVAVNNFKQALDGLGLAGGKLGKLPGIIGKVTKAAASAGVAGAVLAAVAAVTQFAEATAKTGPELQRFTKNLAGSKVSLDALFRDSSGKALTTDLFGLIETTYDLKSALDSIDNDWLGGSDHLFAFGLMQADAGKAADALKNLGNELERMDGIQAAAAFSNIRAEFQGLGKDAEYMSQFFGPYLQKVRDELIAAGPAYQSYVDDAEKLADVASGKLPAGLVMTSEGIRTTQAAIAEGLPYVDHLGRAYEAGEDATSQFAKAQQESAEAAKEQAEALSNAASAIDSYYDAVLGAENGAIALEAAIDDATESVKENGRTLDISTDKGRANRKALLEIADAGLQLARELDGAGKSNDEIIASVTKSRDAFIAAATAMGMGSDEAAAYADQVGLIPDEIITRMELAGGEEAKLSAEEVEQILQRIPEERRAEIRAVLQGVDYARDQLQGLDADADGIDDSIDIAVTQTGAEKVQSHAKDAAAAINTIPDNITTLFEMAQAGADPKQLAEAYDELLKLDPQIRKEIHVKYPELAAAAEQAWLLDRNLDGIPDNKQVQVTSPGLPKTGDDAERLRNTLQLMPERKETHIATPGADDSLTQVGGVLDVLGALPPGVAVIITVPGAGESVTDANNVKAALEGIPRQTSPVITTVGHGAAIRNADNVKAALGGIPRQTTPGIATSGHGAAIANARAVTNALGLIPRRVGVSITATSNVGSVVAGAAAALASINGRVATTTIRTVRSEAALAIGGLVNHAAAAVGLAGGGTPSRRSWPTGGIVEGPGTTTSDSIPALLSRREFVQRARAVEYYGVDVMYALNSMRIPKERLRGYASGGTPAAGPPRYIPTSSIHHAPVSHHNTQQVQVTVQMPATAANSGAASASWLDDFAARARRMSWEVAR